MRSAIKSQIINGIWHSRLYSLTRHLHASRATILKYHSISPDGCEAPSYVSPSISVPMALFEEQVRYIARHCTALSLDELVDLLRRKKRLPPRAVVLTFDDGYADNYWAAFPILTAFKVPATIYLVSSTLTDGRPLWTSVLRFALLSSTRKSFQFAWPGVNLAESAPMKTIPDREKLIRRWTNVLNQLESNSRNACLNALLNHLEVDEARLPRNWFLSREQALEMQNCKISFGAHTVTHPNLPGVAAEEANREIRQAKRDLEEILGAPVRHFSFPNSGGYFRHFDDSCVEMARAAAYESAVTSETGSISGGSDVFRLVRVGINRSWASLPKFLWRIEKTRLAVSA